MKKRLLKIAKSWPNSEMVQEILSAVRLFSIYKPLQKRFNQILNRTDASAQLMPKLKSKDLADLLF